MTGAFSKYRTICGFIAGCAGGALLFRVMYGFSILDPVNIDWCLAKPNDTAQHFIGGWAFLRDAWRWPPGLFCGLSDPDPASIAVVDGIPLAAIVVKLFRGAKPEPFQYLGLWGLICFMLQGGFGFLLAGRFAKRFAVKLAGAFFLLLAVPFLTRYPEHTALSSHFLLLWALYLMVGKWGRTAAAWPVLLTLALVIHPYLFAMCLAVYAGVTLQALIRELRRQRYPAAAKIPLNWLVTGLSCTLAAYLTGLFSIGMKQGSGGFNQSQINLNGFFNPLTWDVSALVAPMPAQNSAENIYLGAGLCLLVLAALPQLFKLFRSDSALWRRRGLPAALLLAMALFAVNCRVYLGNEPVVTFILPQGLKGVWSIFRAAGRFVWPAWYLLAALAVGFAVKGKRRRFGGVLLTVAVLLQLYDLGNGIVANKWAAHLDRPQREYVSPYAELGIAPGKVKKLYYTYTDEDFGDIGYFALKNNLALEDYYFAREFRRTEYQRGVARLLESGVAEPGGLYLLRREEREQLERLYPQLRGQLRTTSGRSALFTPQPR